MLRAVRIYGVLLLAAIGAFAAPVTPNVLVGEGRTLVIFFAVRIASGSQDKKLLVVLHDSAERRSDEINRQMSPHNLASVTVLSPLR